MRTADSLHPRFRTCEIALIYTNIIIDDMAIRYHHKAPTAIGTRSSWRSS